MKPVLFLMMIILSSQALAVSWKVYGPCSEQPVYSGVKPVDLTVSVGSFSVQTFEEKGIPYIGSELGFNSIIGTPTDRNSIEIVSKEELRAYGWCYSVDGLFPEQMPNEVLFQKQNSELVWFYAYSTIKNNQWQDDYCTPAYKVKAPQFCAK